MTGPPCSRLLPVAMLLLLPEIVRAAAIWTDAPMHHVDLRIRDWPN